MKKTKPEEILKEISEDLIIYLKKGTININPFLKNLDYNIDNLDELLELHFLLLEEVKNYIFDLPKGIKNIKTSIKANTKLCRSVKGRISWGQTIKHRLKNGNINQNVYKCSSSYKNFNITENIVLKKFLLVIQKIINQNKTYLETLADDREGNDFKFKELLIINRILKKNIYLNRIDTNNIKITNRMINKTKKSRSEIYRTAAELLEKYRKIKDTEKWDKNIEEIILKIFKNTFLNPKNENELFELYWVFKLIKINSKDEKPQFKLLTENKNNLVASWNNGKDNFYFYHNTTGDKEISFDLRLSDIENDKSDYLDRVISCHNSYNNIVIDSDLNKSKREYIFNKRPDILMVVKDEEDKIKKILIGEVKYTIRENYVLEGLYQLLEYMNLIKINNKYVNTENINIKGILCCDNFEKNCVSKKVEIITYNTD